MLSKEESLKKAKELSYGWHVGDNEFVPLKDVNKLIREIYSIKPYKYEDLKEGMWVWDNENKEVIYIDFIKRNRIYFYTCKYDDGLFYHNFQDSRFYPAQIANVR